MNAERSRPARRIEMLSPQPPVLRWDLALIALLAVLGVIAHPVPRG